MWFGLFSVLSRCCCFCVLCSLAKGFSFGFFSPLFWGLLFSSQLGTQICLKKFFLSFLAFLNILGVCLARFVVVPFVFFLFWSFDAVWFYFFPKMKIIIQHWTDNYTVYSHGKVWMYIFVGWKTSQWDCVSVGEYYYME